MQPLQAKARGWKIIILALMAADMASIFEVSMLFAALPTFYREFKDPVMIGWVMTAYMLVAAAAAGICGRLGDLYGRRRVMLIVMVISVIGSLVAALSHTLEGIIVGRAIHGVSAAVLPLCFGLVSENLPKPKIALGNGIVAGTASTMAGVAFVCGGLVIDYLQWHWIFYLSTGIAVVGILAVWLLVPVSPRIVGKGAVDIVGGVLFAPAVAALLFGFSRGSMWGWSDLRVVGLVVGSLLLFVFWVHYERRHPNPLIDVRLFTNRQVLLTNVCHGLIAIGAMQFGQVMLMLLQQPVWTGVGLGLAATLAATIKLPSSLVAILASPWGGSIAGRRGGRLALVIGLALLTCGWTALTLSHDRVWLIVAAVIINGTGTAIAFSAIPTLIAEVAPPTRISELNGVTQVVRMTCMGIGAQMIAIVFSLSTVSDPSGGAGMFPSASAYLWVFALISLSCLLCLLSALALPPPGTASKVTSSVLPDAI